MHARAHELLEQTLSALARQGISKEAYLRIAGKDEETLAHEAEPEAAGALRREAVLAAIVEAEAIEPSDDELREALEPAAERGEATAPRSCSSSCARRAAWSGCARTWPPGRRSSCSSREAKPITVEQAKAREKLWTPGKDEGERGRRAALDAGQLDARPVRTPPGRDRPSSAGCYIRGRNPAAKQKKRGP